MQLSHCGRVQNPTSVSASEHERKNILTAETTHEETPGYRYPRRFLSNREAPYATSQTWRTAAGRYGRISYVLGAHIASLQHH